MRRIWMVVATTLIVLAGTYESQRSPHAAASGRTYQVGTTETPTVTATVTAALTPPPPPSATPNSQPTATPTSPPSPTVTPTRAPTPRIKPRAYYLALGDSVAYGYQPNFDLFHGYADTFYQFLKPRGARHLINLACPGETSTTFIRGGCPFRFLVKHPHLGPQLGAALSFIHGHAGQVSPVTITIGGNDFLSAFHASTCTVDPREQAILATFDANFRSILSRLSAALHGSKNMVTMTYYDPYQNECLRNPRVLSLMQRANAHIVRDAATYHVRVANVFAAFGGPKTPNPQLCGYSWICSRYHDIHPTRQGYAVIARAFETTAGY